MNKTAKEIWLPIKDYENYLKHISFEVQHLISKEYFLKGDK